MKCFGLLAIVCCMSRFSVAGTFMTGNTFMDKCANVSAETGNSVDFGYCVGYVEGVSDMIDMEQTRVNVDGSTNKAYICTSPDVTAGQMLRVVQKFIKDHPETQHYAAPALINNAFVKAFPCK